MCESKTQKRLKERFLTRWNRTKRANFQGSPHFQATNNIKTKNKQLIQLILCQLNLGGWRKEKSTRATGRIVIFGRSIQRCHTDK